MPEKVRSLCFYPPQCLLSNFQSPHNGSSAVLPSRQSRPCPVLPAASCCVPAHSHAKGYSTALPAWPCLAWPHQPPLTRTWQCWSPALPFPSPKACSFLLGCFPAIYRAGLTRCPASSQPWEAATMSVRAGTEGLFGAAATRTWPYIPQGQTHSNKQSPAWCRCLLAVTHPLGKSTE